MKRTEREGERERERERERRRWRARESAGGQVKKETVVG